LCVRPFRYQGVDNIESNELARLIVEIAEDKKASNIILLDIRNVSILADYFVICSGNSERQVKAIARDIEERLKEQEVMVAHREGMDPGRWVLLDYSDVIVHVFTPTERDYYRLEKLWSGAQTVLVVQ
jgi:ribosome-associated protein